MDFVFFGISELFQNRKEVNKMKNFYSQLEQAEQKKDARLSQLAQVCNATLSDIRANEELEPWSWWTEE
jgi:hypothetical protein